MKPLPYWLELWYTPIGRQEPELAAMSAENPRIGVVSGRYPATEFEAFINHIAYCEQHGYTYIYANWPTGERNRYLNKMGYVRAYHHLFDYLFWIDDDAFFIDLDQDLESFLPKSGDFLSICGSPTHKRIHTFVSSGQFMLRCDETGRAFIDAVMQTDLNEVRRWWSESLGYFTGGDQDSMVYLLKTDSRFSRFERYSYKAFNSRVEDLFAGERVFILHFTGTMPVKRRSYERVQRHLNRGPSLLPIAEARRRGLVNQRGLRARVTRLMRRVLNWV